MAIFIIYAISLVYPFVYLLANSFKSYSEFAGLGDFATANIFGFPTRWIWDNFIKAFNELRVDTVKTNIGLMYLSSITLAIGETAVSMAMTCCAAYVLARFDFKGKKFVYNLVLVTSFIPAISSLPAIYTFMDNTKLINTYIGMLILNAAAFGGPFLFISSYFKMIPWSFAESAQMDGAGNFRIFTTIMIPLAKNGIITFTILKFLGFWNDYWYPQLFYSDYPTLAVGIAKITETERLPVVSAVMIMAIVPVLIFYAIFQKKLLANTLDGGLK
ncbi:MAG: carbohydrate ABC transporter permease [Bacilli bacterium]|nr:carbohydrate ABC transporter permease [Bacilli bacterium]